MSDGPPDRIRLVGLRLACIVGILPEERERAQSVILDFEAALDATAAATTGDLASTLDYAALARDLTFILESGRFRLLETAGLALCQYSLATGPDLAWVKVSLTKPGALGGRGVPTVCIERTANHAPKRTGDGRVSQTADAAIDCLPAGASAPKHPDYPQRTELALAGGRRLVVSRR